MAGLLFGAAARPGRDLGGGGDVVFEAAKRSWFCETRV
jgi:hypothetical protein